MEYGKTIPKNSPWHKWVYEIIFSEMVGKKWLHSLGVETGYPDPKGKVFLGVEISNIYGQYPRTA